MSIEIEVLNGDESWPMVEPLFNEVWPPHALEKLSWGDIQWAHADLRVLIEAASGAVACHAGIYFRTVNWNGRKYHIGGIGGLATGIASQRQGYATLALNAAIRTLRDHEAVEFALLFCEPQHFAFYQSRGWHPFAGEIYATQPEGQIRFQALAPFVFDFKRSPRQGVIDLCGLPW